MKYRVSLCFTTYRVYDDVEASNETEAIEKCRESWNEGNDDGQDDLMIMPLPNNDYAEDLSMEDQEGNK